MFTVQFRRTAGRTSHTPYFTFNSMLISVFKPKTNPNPNPNANLNTCSKLTITLLCTFLNLRSLHLFSHG